MTTNDILPILSEKSYAISKKRFYVFSVPRSINKISIAKQIEEQFDVQVASVNVTTIKGKSKKVISITGKRYLNSEGSRSTIKKAYVYLKEGFSLPIFDALEEENEKETKTQEKFDEIAKKEEAKSTKKPRRLLSKNKKEEKK